MGFNGIGHFADLFGPSTTTAVEQMFHQQQQQPSFQMQQQHFEECCVPTGDCVMRSSPIRPDDPRAAELYARVACSDAGCPAGRYMHRECFDAWERLVLAFMKNAAATYSSGRTKDLWTVNVNNNNVVNLNQKGYDMAFKACACRCGRGYLRKDPEWPSAVATTTASSRRRSSGSGGYADDADCTGAAVARSVAGKKKKRRPTRSSAPQPCAVPACATMMTVDYTELRLRAGSLSGSSNGSSSPVTGGTGSTGGSSVSPAHSGSFGGGSSSTTGTAGSSASSSKRRGAANASSPPGSCFKDVFER